MGLELIKPEQMKPSDFIQSAMIYDYTYDCRERFNEELMTRNDNAIVEELLKVIYSCQRERFFTIKIKGHRVVEDPEEINDILYNYEEDRFGTTNRKRNKENRYEYINMKDSAIRLLIVTYYVAFGDETDVFDVIIATPRIVNKFYFKIMGKYYYPMFQIVDGSTYNNHGSMSKKQSVTLKTVFQPIRIYRNSIKLKDVNKENINCINFSSNIFNKNIPALKYIFARYGFIQGLLELGIQDIYITEKDPVNENWYTFEKNNLFISTPKILFEREHMVQSIVYTLYRTIAKDTKKEDIYGPSFWLKSLGSDFNSYTIEKGYGVLESLESLYDPSTRDAIALPYEKKSDIYKILLWMCREFSNLMTGKDNLDISTKKVRYAEYIAALYAMRLSKGIHRVSDMGRKASVKNLKQALDTIPFFLISEITKCKLVNYRDIVNDDDAVPKFTYKGPSGLGDNKSSSIPEHHRRLQISHLGVTDPHTSSSSDPGITGMLCPYLKLHNKVSISDYQEPDNWEENFSQLMNDYKALTGMIETVRLKKSIGLDTSNTNEEMLEDSLEIVKKLIEPVRFVEETTIMPVIFVNRGGE